MYNKNILITGVTGFVGGNLAKQLNDLGANIFGIVRNENPTCFLTFEKLDKKIRLIKGDLSQVNFMYDLITENNIEYIFHLAAQVEVGVAIKNPYLTFETNVRGTYNLLEACKRAKDAGHQIKSIIVASSDKAYGEYPVEKMPYEESYPLIPKYPYDTSKACADMISKSYSIDEYGLPIIITRFANIYGPGQLNFSAIVPDSIRGALGYTKLIPRSNGLMVRDFLFVEDVSDLYITISEHLSKKPNLSGEIFNAGSNSPIDIKSLVKLIYNLLGNKSELNRIIAEMDGKKTVGEIFHQHMSYKKVHEYFGWKPKNSLESGLKSSIKWYKKYLNQ
tara:strand:+ start:11692 stop:12693 length:1002 start_codon:yes stop_codon:yes gene_type:complete